MTLEVLRLLRHAPRSKSEIANALGKAKPNRYLNELMSRLIETGHLAYSVPDKPRSRLQKYRLTSKGHKALEGRTGQGIRGP